ncbi:S9 family peptidase [uncultured Deinococcus sp.]|uniref:S9 family peptidase n=1 Tax=uncultured Deinococcus sp. TaxID=158789 RepID=UPI0025D2EB05|nr:S9 family peptidase [uncultured Deinococcus sp.]
MPTPHSLLALAFPSDPRLSPDGRRVAFVLSRIEEEDVRAPDEQFARPRYKSHIWVAEHGQMARPFTAGEGRDSAPRWSPDGTQLAFVRDSGGFRGQLHLLPVSGGEARRLTHLQHPVQDVQWSPDGRYLSFLSSGDDQDRRDERGEPRVITTPRYRFNGQDWLPERPARLWRYDVLEDHLDEWHVPAVAVTAYAWRPDSSGVLFVSAVTDLNAAHWEQEVFGLPLQGAPTQLTRWNSAITAVVPHPDGERFAVVGRPEGQGNTEHTHVYVLGADDRVIRLDGGHDHPVGNAVGGDCHVGAMPNRPVWLDDRTLLFSSTVRGSCGLFLASLAPDSAEGTVTAHDHRPDGVIAAFTAVPGGGVALLREQAHVFPEVELNGVPVTDLNARLPFAARRPLPVTFSTPLGDGEGWVLLPDGDGPVPAVLTIHGGPHTDYGHAFTHEFQLLAAQGYGVCYSNPRGSIGYGQAWVDAIHGRWGSVDIDDLLGFFDTCLAQHAALDPARTAVMGGSYGGFMTNWITAHTPRFQAAITDRSICNLISFAGTSDIGLRFWEDELGLSVTRRADTAALWDMSPLQYVENVRTPTLIVHSALDHRCPVEQAEQWYAALTQLGVPTRFVRFPGEDHELSRSGRPDRRVRRLQETLEWLGRWLGPVPDAG